MQETNEKLDFKKILPVVVILFVDLLGLSIMIPLLPFYAARFGADAFVVGLLSATYPTMQFIGAPLLGRLSDRVGRRPVLLVSQVGTLIGFIIMAFANTLWVLFISRIIDGISGANISTAQAVITDSTTEKTRTQGLGLVGAAFGMGFITGPIIAFLVLAATGGNYQAVAIAAALFSLLSILLTAFWLPETLNREKATEYRKAAQHREKRKFTFGSVLGALNRPVLGFLLLLMFAQQLAFGGYEQLFSLFTLNRLGLDATSTAGVLVLAGLSIVVMQGVFVGRWSKQKGDRWLVMMGLLTLGISLTLTATTPQIAVPWYDKARVVEGIRGHNLFTQNINVELPNETPKSWLGIIWLLVASIPATLGGAVLHPGINSLITKAVSKNEIGEALGRSASMYSAGNAIAPLFYGSLFSWLGPPVPFLAGGILLVVLWLVSMKAIKVIN
jgi:DHA1 family tetracycline resistance protein-like MFS transporter